MSDKNNKFFHRGVVEKVTISGKNSNLYTDQRIDAVYEDLKEVGKTLDAKFTSIEKSLKQTDSAFCDEILEVNKYLKTNRTQIKRHTIIHVVQAITTCIGWIVLALLLVGCSTGIKTVYNKGYPSSVVDRVSKIVCKRVISIVEVNRRKEVFGRPCQVYLIYD